MPDNPFARRCEKIARRFLLTAVVVDDELHASGDASGDSQVADLAAPRRGQSSLAAPTDPPSNSDRPLKVDPITWAFAREGMVCGVVSPRNGRRDRQTVAKAVARADIVILDWRLNRETDENALPLLECILTGDPPHRLRLVAFYTGEPNHGRIRHQIAAHLEHLEALDAYQRTPEVTGDDGQYIDFGACRIVVYGKSGSPTFGQSTTVDEKNMADRLISDFAGMVEGLLPCLALTALAAVRENVYRLLKSFGKDLDPAFLTHRACLPQPAEAEQHMVEQIASELYGIMEDVVGRESPAGIEAIEDWLTERFGDDRVVFDSDAKWKATVAEVVAMLKEGIQKQPVPKMAKGKHPRFLSRGFSGNAQDGTRLDRRLASAMSFRQVVADTSRQMSMGTVVRRLGKEAARSDGADLFLCITPRCDSVRLTMQSSFLFVPLVSPKSRTTQVVVPAVGQDAHRRLTIELNPSLWVTADFDPDPARQCVLARPDGSDQVYTFKDAGGEEYRWVGELKAEFAQSIAQAIAGRMARVPLNKSEWLRRMEHR